MRSRWSEGRAAPWGGRGAAGTGWRRRCWARLPAWVRHLRVMRVQSLWAFTAFIRNGTRSGDTGVQVLEPGRDIGAICGAGHREESAGQAAPAADRGAEAGPAGSGGTARLTIAGHSALPTSAKDLADLGR